MQRQNYYDDPLFESKFFLSPFKNWGFFRNLMISFQYFMAWFQPLGIYRDFQPRLPRLGIFHSPNSICSFRYFSPPKPVLDISPDFSWDISNPIPLATFSTRSKLGLYSRTQYSLQKSSGYKFPLICVPLTPGSFLFPSCLVGNLFPLPGKSRCYFFKDLFSIWEYLS